jgi:hypothetical protein
MPENDSEDPDDWSEKKKGYEERLASGDPMFGVLIDLPMKVIRDGQGGLFLDSPTFGLMGFDRLGVARAHLTASAVDSLKRALVELEKNPDAQVVEIKKPAAN